MEIIVSEESAEKPGYPAKTELGGDCSTGFESVNESVGVHGVRNIGLMAMADGTEPESSPVPASSRGCVNWARRK